MANLIEPPDALTGLPARRSCDDCLQREIQYAANNGTSVVVILMDLDHFKSINDGFGHARGDTVLAEFASRIQSTIRDDDRAFRYGGDEFVLVLPHTDLAKAQVLAGRLQEIVQSSPFSGDPPLLLTLSGGIACFPEDARAPAELLAAADRRLYQVKRSGRAQINGVDFDDPGILPASNASHLIERDLALETAHNFINQMQPPNPKERSVLVVYGKPKSGRSHLLSEICTAAQMRGFGMITLKGSPALQRRALGVWLEAQSDLHLLSPIYGVSRFSHALQRELVSHKLFGLFICIDNPNYLDQASIDFLRNLYYSQDTHSLAVIYSSAPQAGLLLDEVEQTRIEVTPLSLIGVQIWLRHYLFWEAPIEFTAWLHQQTGGLPGLLSRGLDLLITQKVITHIRGKWECQTNYISLPLAERLAKLSEPPNNLPTGMTLFVGRSAEIHELLRLTHSERLVTVVGPGGIGKSRLAIQVAAERHNDFPDGIFFIPLAAVNTADFIIPALAEAMHLQFTGNTSLKDQWLDFIRHRHVLLVMDNFEHLTDSAPLLRDLLNEAPGVYLLITSRTPLNLVKEQVFELGCLNIPSPETGTDLSGYESVQLFNQVANQSNPAFVFSGAEGQSVARICRLVEGMPLGIEMAAAWVHSFSTDQIAAEIERSLAFLVSSRPEISPRHHSMVAVFDSFWQVLSELEQQVIAQMAVFKGGFRREAARQVANVSPLFLDALVSKAFLHLAPSGRYEMHELLRQYGVEKLYVDAAFENHTRELHCAYYLNFIQSQEGALSRERQAVANIAEEIENVREAWKWALEHQRLLLIQPAINGLGRYYELTGLWEEGVKTFGSGAACLESNQPFNHLSPQEQSIYLLLKYHQGRLLRHLARYDMALSALQTARSGWETQNNHEGQVLALAQMGLAFYHKGKYAEAREYLNQGLALARAVNDRNGAALTLDQLSYLYWAQGDYSTARTLAEESLAIQRTLGDKLALAGILNILGIIVESQGDLMAGQALYEETLLLYREMGDKPGIAKLLVNLGDTLISLGDPVTARATIEEGLALGRETGFKLVVNVALLNLGSLAIELNDAASAQSRFMESLLLSQEMSERSDVIYSIAGLAAVAAQQAEFFRAARLAAAAETNLKTMGGAWDVLEGRVFQFTLKRLHSGMSENDFKTAWDAGEKMTLEEATALAMENI
jgi:diguanylate cyclase (GGDEF)-like protein